jgi:hypothetical protein
MKLKQYICIPLPRTAGHFKKNAEVAKLVDALL